MSLSPKHALGQSKECAGETRDISRRKGLGRWPGPEEVWTAKPKIGDQCVGVSHGISDNCIDTKLLM